MFHDTLNTLVSSLVQTLEGYPRISGLVVGLAFGRILQTVSSVLR